MPPKRRDAGPAGVVKLPAQGRLDPVEARILDPNRSLPVEGSTPRPTAYVGTRLLIAKGPDLDAKLEMLREVAESVKWTVRLDREPVKARDLTLGIRTATIRALNNEVEKAPDAWFLLQKTRLLHGHDSVRGISLDHVVSTRQIGPQNWEIPHAPGPENWEIPHSPEPDNWEIPHPASSGVSAGLESYGRAGFGGRQPVTYMGAPPARFTDAEIKGRRPVVAIVDTGCARHDWLDRAVVRNQKLDNHAIGYTLKTTDPEVYGDQVGPFDGAIDRTAGHGTFIAGLVHQNCPDAEILAWRGVPSDGPLIESDWITTLAQIAELNRRARHGEQHGKAIDVLNLSMGYYHESAADELLDPILRTILDAFADNGVVVVCSAGNDATDRPCYPAAFAPWDGEQQGPRPTPASTLPVVSVGALNPNRSDALFTNAGPWVRVYAPGASVVSTFPKFRGGLEPVARTSVLGRGRESIDPDDFRSGFAVWSGTSFAAPAVAGTIAAAMLPELMKQGFSDTVPAARKRGWAAVATCTKIRPD